MRRAEPGDERAADYLTTSVLRRGAERIAGRTPIVTRSVHFEHG